ncbi:UvrC [Synechococcus phage S-CREM2]|nr:UvrC [Synechococcus phage S-CREM2]
MNYYVYAFLRQDLFSPYYIGKGKGNRINKQGKRKATLPPVERRVKIAENLTEEAALELERLLILMWGRKCDGGVLLNEQEGGTQPPGYKGGKKWSPEARARWAEKCKGRTPWNKGKKGLQRHTDAAKEKCRQAGLRGGRPKKKD